MNISSLQKTLQAEAVFEKSPTGWPLSEHAVQSVQAALSDTKNMDADGVQCKNCGLIISILLVGEGCPNCGSIDMDVDVNQLDVL